MPEYDGDSRSAMHRRRSLARKTVRPRRSGGRRRSAPRPPGTMGGALPSRRGRGAGVARRRRPRADGGLARADRAAEAALRIHEADRRRSKAAAKLRAAALADPIRRRSPARRTRRRSAATGCIRVLGEGGFGRVYLAYDADLHREVAVKVPLAGDASRFLDVEAYLREARIVARLSHPNIVPVYDVGRTDDGRCYVVSKYMEGGDLRRGSAAGGPAFAESAELIAVLCDALQYTHTQDLFHRDIKPANILLDAAGVPSLADFGLALRDEDVGRGAGYLGTAAYMSPEQARGEGHRVDGRSDIFSIGVVFYELLTGRRPFRGSSHVEIMHQVISAEPRPPRQIDGTIPGELERICLKALAKRASERYTTARDLAEDLRHFLETASWTGGPTAELPPAVASAREPARTARRRRTRASRPIRIVPKGLGSFDEHDADFFLELLPGPRDRDGLPDGLRFWKTRIEATDPDRAFRVGLIYGPSGCGKSSMVKAGLLPRLGPQVCAIYVEAAGAETEARLLRGPPQAVPRPAGRRRIGRRAESPPARPRAARGPQGAPGPGPVRAVALRPPRPAGRRAGRRAAAVRRRAHPGPLPGAGRLLDGGDAVHEGPRHRPGPRAERGGRRPLRAAACAQGAGGLRPCLRCPAAAIRRALAGPGRPSSTRRSPGWRRTAGSCRCGWRSSPRWSRAGPGRPRPCARSAAWTASASSSSRTPSARPDRTRITATIRGRRRRS